MKQIEMKQTLVEKRKRLQELQIQAYPLNTQIAILEIEIYQLEEDIKDAKLQSQTNTSEDLS